VTASVQTQNGLRIRIVRAKRQGEEKGRMKRTRRDDKGAAPGKAKKGGRGGLQNRSASSKPQEKSHGPGKGRKRGGGGGQMRTRHF